jgi:hypothetical protein
VIIKLVPSYARIFQTYNGVPACRGQSTACSYEFWQFNGSHGFTKQRSFNLFGTLQTVFSLAGWECGDQVEELHSNCGFSLDMLLKANRQPLDGTQQNQPKAKIYSKIITQVGLLKYGSIQVRFTLHFLAKLSLCIFHIHETRDTAYVA